jgi:hypothetical protein
MNDAIPEPAQIYLQLRNRIFSLKPAEIGLNPSSAAPHVWGVLMETGYQVGYATLVSLADGTTGLYYSTGGGMLGSAEYTPVADASKALVAQAESHLQQVSSTNEFPLPEVGQVRFTILTYSGIFAGEAPEKTLASGKHQLSSLYFKAQQTLEQLRVLSEKKQKSRWLQQNSML